MHSDGTGLELYLVKLIIDAAGSSVWLECEEARGTTFYVQIPAEGIKEIGGDNLLHKEEHETK